MEAPASLDDPETSFGHVLELGDRGMGVKLRFNTWVAGGLAAGVAVELMENPNGAKVTWSVRDPNPEGPKLRILVESGTGGLEIRGRINPAGATFVPE
ncbi:MAG: hypothetical protein DRJ42_07210 [Deltaproteobacteria bacterium]|nr:MAG: hypothetical protein DRJ42_07210 [Deltaproteobacteria bacterium]